MARAQGLYILRFSIFRDVARELFQKGLWKPEGGRSEGDDGAMLSQLSINQRMHHVLYILRPFMKESENSAHNVKCVTIGDIRLTSNPFYQLYRQCSVTDGEIAIYYLLLSMLDGESPRISEIKADERMTNVLEDRAEGLTTVVRLINLLKSEGMLVALKNYRYTLSPARLKRLTNDAPLLGIPNLDVAVSFFSEESPLGAIGAGIMAATDIKNELFVFKHHQISQALDSIVLLDILEAISSRADITLNMYDREPITLTPICVRESVVSGEQYLCARRADTDALDIVPLDEIDSVVCALQAEPAAEASIAAANKAIERIWTRATGDGTAKRVVVEICFDTEFERYIERRIRRESRNCEIKYPRDGICSVEFWVNEPEEMLPWLLSLAGRVISISDARLYALFVDEIDRLYRLYDPKDPNSSLALKRELVPVDPEFINRRNTNAIYSPLFSEINNESLVWLQSAFEAYRASESDAEFIEYLKRVDLSIAHYFLGSRYYEDERDSMSAELLKTLRRQYGFMFNNRAFNCAARPLRTIEARWLKTIMRDPKFDMFIDEAGRKRLEEILGNRAPLNAEDDIRRFDEHTDGDDFKDPKYRARFRTLCDAIQNKRSLSIFYIPHNGIGFPALVRPLKIEYSKLDSKFRVYCYRPGETHERITLLLSNIQSITVCEHTLPPAPDWISFSRSLYEPEPIRVRIPIDSHALTRFARSFSIYQKETSRNAVDRLFEAELTYQKEDVNELIIRLISCGADIKVLSPSNVVTEIYKRVCAQFILDKSAAATHAHKP